MNTAEKLLAVVVMALIVLLFPLWLLFSYIYYRKNPPMEYYDY